MKKTDTTLDILDKQILLFSINCKQQISIGHVFSVVESHSMEAMNALPAILDTLDDCKINNNSYLLVFLFFGSAQEVESSIRTVIKCLMCRNIQNWIMPDKKITHFE